MSYLEFNKRHAQLLLSILLFLLTFIAYDTYVDHKSNVGRLHIWVEIFLLILTFILFYISLKKFISNSEKKDAELGKLRSEYHQLKKKLSLHKQDMHQYIQMNFTNWKLTNSEKDIALLLFKGCTGKEISGIRNTNYQTVRSQISNIYRKAQVSNHNQFMAILIEDLI